MRYKKIIIKFLLSILLTIFLIEGFVRLLIFFPTNIDVFKYGFKKTIKFDVVDLSKFQISIYDTDKNLKNIKFYFDEKFYMDIWRLYHTRLYM